MADPDPIALMVREALADALEGVRPPASIQADEKLFVDLGLDSVAYLQVWTALEAKLGRRVDDEDLLGEIRTVADLVQRVRELSTTK